MSKDLKLTLDYNYMMKDYIGEHGIAEESLRELAPKFAKAHKAMIDKKDAGMMDFRKLPFNQEEVIKEIESYAGEVKDKFDALVVLGIGGSALGPIAVHQAINHPFYNELKKEDRGYPKLYVLDNVDPEKIVALCDVVDIEKCLFNVISKSGSTSETMSQFMIIEDMLIKKMGENNIKDNIVFTTDKEKGNLVKISKMKGYRMFVVPESVGGRFSELTPVGLLPAAICGINIRELLSGAGLMEELCTEEDIFKNPAYMYAALHYIAMNEGKNISVMMPYADSLKYMSDWYAQLWAESLGKKKDNNGNIINTGQTPVRALGATDQHSQVQLYTEGPYDKIIVILACDEYKKELMIPKVYDDIDSISFLGGHSQNKLIKVEQESTEYALMRSGKMNMTLNFKRVNEHTIGQFIMLLEVATAFMGELLEINAFDQPGVEEGKNATYAMFNKPGYEEKKNELTSARKKEDKYKI